MKKVPQTDLLLSENFRFFAFLNEPSVTENETAIRIAVKRENVMAMAIFMSVFVILIPVVGFFLGASNAHLILMFAGGLVTSSALVFLVWYFDQSQANQPLPTVDKVNHSLVLRSGKRLPKADIVCIHQYAAKTTTSNFRITMTCAETRTVEGSKKYAVIIATGPDEPFGKAVAERFNIPLETHAKCKFTKEQLAKMGIY